MTALGCARESVLPSSSPTDPIPQRAKVFVIEGQAPNVFIKIDGVLQSCFRLLHVARDTRVAGEVKSNQGTLGMQRSRFKKNCFRSPDILGTPYCIGEIDPRGRIFGICFHEMSGDSGGHVPFLGT
jgi:hypothetical protein